MKIDLKNSLFIWDCFMLLIIIIAVLIRSGIMTNPYTPEYVQMFAMVGMAGAGVYVFHRLDTHT